MEDGLCLVCGLETLDTIGCNCTQEIYVCETCSEASEVGLRCDSCREWEQRCVPLSAYSCRDFREDEAGVGMAKGGRLPATAPVGAWGPPYRAVRRRGKPRGG